MTGDYNIEKERIKRIERLALEVGKYGRQISDYKERESWGNMGGI